MASNCLGLAGHGCRPRYQPLLPAQPSPLLRTFEDETDAVGLLDEGRPGVVSLRLLGVHRKLAGGLRRDGYWLPCVRPFRPKACALPGVFLTFLDSLDDYGSSLETH